MAIAVRFSLFFIDTPFYVIRIAIFGKYYMIIKLRSVGSFALLFLQNQNKIQRNAKRNTQK